MGGGSALVRSPRPARPLVRLGNNALVGDGHPADHEQSQVLDDVSRERIVADIVALDVKAKALPLQPATVRECDVEVEDRALVHR